ncbi:DUF4252 domain-containing protein [Tenacibaculum sp. UWU-22]|uniref:DUF4252 domain-containing protein n=1 Tax=Tenacibaculum sp. UWU-22 TaxID=3234187 RepID=UPI0034DB2A9E
MKKTGLYALIIPLLFIACQNEASLQNYLVESQDKEDFLNLDIPASVLELNTNEATQEQLEAYKTIRKINIVALPYSNSNEQEYQHEKQRLQAIFKNPKYKSVLKFNTSGRKMFVYYLGDPEAIDEIVAFGYGKELGVGVARLLGDNMNPSKILAMVKNVKVDSTNVQLIKFKNWIKKNKNDIE